MFGEHIKMKLFLTKPLDYEPTGYFLSASHKWSLPGAKCDVCGFTGGTVGIQYPCLNLPASIESKPYRNVWPVSVQRLNDLTKDLRKFIPDHLPLRASSGFGPLVGKGHGNFPNIVWNNSWTLLFSPSVVEHLKNFGFNNLCYSRPEIALRSKKPFQHVEIQIEPLLHLDYSCVVPGTLDECSNCGRRKMKLIDADYGGLPSIRADSIPKEMVLARIIEWPTQIVASETFVEAISFGRIKGISFTELKVITR